MKKCAKCDSEKIVPKAVVDTFSVMIDVNSNQAASDFRLAVDGDPSAFIFREREYSDIFASVCADCGYTEFYAAQPEKLYRASQKSVSATV